MIVSGRTGHPCAQLPAFSELPAEGRGQRPDGPDNIQSLENQKPFSVVGIPGRPGCRDDRFAPSDRLGDTGGNIVGYLQKNQAADADGGAIFDVVTPEHITYDTKFASTRDLEHDEDRGTSYTKSLDTNEPPSSSWRSTA